MAFTSGKYAFAICDRCGDKVKYKNLKSEWTGLFVCEDCLDHKTKQEFPSNFPVDPESLRNPRPDNDVTAGNGTIYVFDSVHGQTPIGLSWQGFKATSALNSVTVSTT